ncbi:Zinc finger protein zas1 [Beauveria bassiana]|nr:Zinc finger protein zas1 [Beauveria bassiana]
MSVVRKTVRPERHGRTHDGAHRGRKNRKRSCLACASAKTKCSEEVPSCERCDIKGLTCVYASEKLQPRNDDLDLENHTCPEGGETGEIVVSGVAGSFPLATTATLFNPSFPDQQLLSHELVPSQMDVSYTEALLDDSGTVEQQPEPAWWSQTALDQFIGVADFYPTYTSPSSWEWQSPTTTLNMIPGPISPVASAAAVAAPLCYPFGAVPSGSVLPKTEPQLYYSNSTGSEVPAPVSNPLSNGEPPDRMAVTLDKPSSPTPGHRQPERPTKTLPALAGGPQEPFPILFSIPPATSATRKNLENYLRLPLTQSLWTPMSIVEFPSAPQLDYFIDLYFANFDTLLPMIHRPTFDLGAYPVLTLSMCAIGVLYSDFENARAFSKALCELLRRLFVCMSEQNAMVTRSYEFLAAQTLQSVLSNSSSGKRLFEFGDNNRSLVVASARAAGLFANRRPKAASDKSNGASSVQEQWLSWIQAERLRRLAWSIYIFDASATYYRNCRPHLSLVEMKVDLPASTSHWEAESSRAWASLQPWTNGAPPRNASFRETLERLVARHSSSSLGPDATQSLSPDSSISSTTQRLGRNAEETDEFHLILMTTTLLRTVWDYRDCVLSLQGPAPMPELFTHSVPSKDMDTALSLLTTLAATAPLEAIASATGAGSQSFNGLSGLHEERQFHGLVHRTRISLVAQIIAADQISNHLDAEWRRGAAAGDQNVREVAAERLRAWGETYPVEVRRMARIGAQLLSISRLYPYHMPREPYDAFRAGLLLWTMAPLIRAATPVASSQASPARAPTHRRVCQLDWLGDQNSPEGACLQEWIDHGGDHFVLRMHEIPDICTRQGSRQILLSTSKVLQKLHVWGASEVYRDIVLRALREDERAHRDNNPAASA